VISHVSIEGFHQEDVCDVGMGAKQLGTLLSC
jgi:hypothetical protein